MKEDREFIDDLFKSHLESQKFDVPSDFINDIVGRIEAKKKTKKRRVIFILFTSSFIFLLGFVFFSTLIKSNEKDKNTNIKVVKSSEKQKIVVKTPSSSPKKTDSLKKEKSIIIKSSLFKTQTNKNSSLSKSNFRTKNKNKKQINEIKETTSKYSNSLTQTNQNQIEKKEMNSVISENINHHDSIQEKSIDTLTVVDNGKKDSLKVAANGKKTEKKELLKTTVNTSTNDIKMREIQIYSGYQINLMDKNSRNNASINNIRSDFASNFSIGINVQFEHKKIIIGSGFELNKWKEKYSWNQQNLYLQDSVLINMSIPIPYATDTTGLYFNNIKVNDVIYYYQTQSTQYKSSNTLNIIQLPFYFGYKFKIQKFEFIPKVGINTGLVRGDNFVQLPQFNANSISNTSVPNSPFIPAERNHFIVSYQIGVDFRKQFENWYIYVNPYYRNGISSLIQNDRKLLIQYGWNFGLGFYFKER
jgi:hypothetical protein